MGTMLLQYVPKAKAEIPWLWDIAPSDREIRVATANVQTMNPKDEHRGASWEASARRTALAMQFKANGLDVIGIQEGRSRIAGRCEIEGYHVLRGQASPAGQYGCELWVSAELCPDPKQLKVFKEQPRMLMVSGPRVTDLRGGACSFIIQCRDSRPSRGVVEGIQGCPASCRQWPKDGLDDRRECRIQARTGGPDLSSGGRRRRLHGWRSPLCRRV